MELNKHWDEIQKEKGNTMIHVIVPGNKKEVEAMKTELGLTFDVIAADLEYHKAVGLVIPDEQAKLHPLRGYAIIKDGNVIEAEPDDTVGERSVEVIKMANQ